MLSVRLRAFAALAAVALASGSARASAILEMFVSNGTETPSGLAVGGPATPGGPVVIDIFLTVGSEGIGYLTFDLVTSSSIPFGFVHNPDNGSGVRPVPGLA